jgi:hypothetical protein
MALSGFRVLLGFEQMIRGGCTEGRTRRRAPVVNTVQAAAFAPVSDRTTSGGVSQFLSGTAYAVRASGHDRHPGVVAVVSKAANASP